MEEGQPLIEERLRGILYDPKAKGATIIKGRLDGTLPRTGELNPDSVRKALGLAPAETYSKSEVTVPRPPALCQGCGHRDFYTALNVVLKEYAPSARVFSDIGCYTLGYMPPFNSFPGESLRERIARDLEDRIRTSIRIILHQIVIGDAAGNDTHAVVCPVNIAVVT